MMEHDGPRKFSHKTNISSARSKRLRRLSKRQKRDLVVGTVLTIIVCVFFLCHSLKFVINMVELCAVVAGTSTIILAIRFF